MDIAGIFADWGTTNRRAWAVDRAGTVLEHRKDEHGLLGVKDRAFEASFRDFAGDWLTRVPGAPILMAGMVGSKLGWREAPYVETPAAFADLARHMVELPSLDGHPVRIVPGLVCRASGTPDVMRGEETQLFGLWLQAHDDRLCVLPGTHSKWAEIKGDGVAGFRTYMTGEVFAQLSGSGTIAQLMRRDAPHDAAAFRRGFETVDGRTAGGLLNRLFSARTLGLFAELPGEAIGSYLSGLLIGAELRDALAAARPGKPIAVIGSSRMNALYLEGLALLGAPAEAIDGDTLLRPALLEIGRQSRLM
ncbi:MAG TPA: 2-dehydro-3-deoxygalactonokinase [Dongiaceae bacterium]|jgi:2-dehydro-3-deoxygalactonokinase|nr:2-dehydro-3-deoxygalactonokinase [Dongiaceae bacterium]